MNKPLNLVIILSFIFLISCKAMKPEKVDTRNTPINAQERARKNVNEGQGTSLKSILGNRGSTRFEFSTSNPMWRASLEVLDFLPLTTVDYAGGMIITDWYSEQNNNESIKLTVRFLGNEVRTENLKIIVHKKNCKNANSCTVTLLKNSAINNELLASIIRIAAKMENDSKKKK